MFRGLRRFPIRFRLPESETDGAKPRNTEKRKINVKKRNETKQRIETVRIERNARRTKENNSFGGDFERRIHCIHTRSARGGGGKRDPRVVACVRSYNTARSVRAAAAVGDFCPSPTAPHPRIAFDGDAAESALSSIRIQRRPPADGSLLQSVFEYHRSRLFEFGQISRLNEFIIYEHRNYKILLKTQVRNREFRVHHPRV